MNPLLLLFFGLISISAHRFITPRNAMSHFSATAVFNEETTKVNSADFKGKYVVLIFYPFDFTYVCPTELIAFSERMPDFKKLKTEVYGISTDSHFTHLAWLKTDRKQGGVGNLAFPLISDFSKDISRSYGFLVEDKDDELYGAALRGLVIIDGKGIVRHLQVNDAPVGRSVEEVLRLIEAFQYTDDHGVVCPANWKAGAKTIVPDQKRKMEYFNEEF